MTIVTNLTMTNFVLRQMDKFDNYNNDNSDNT